MSRPAVSEIDDIFKSASKSAPLPAPTLVSSKAKGKTKAADEDGAAKKKMKKKKNKTAQEAASSRATDAGDKPSVVPSAKRKRPEPETVVHPSTAPSTLAKRPKTARKDGTAGVGKIKEKNIDDEQRFRDSRGTGPRRKTDEGFSIYKEDELGIRDEGGDTPLCPFDCDCCF